MENFYFLDFFFKILDFFAARILNVARNVRGVASSSPPERVGARNWTFDFADEVRGLAGAR